ncbi:P-loop containing nucleoside triphosphate hydrolase protein [Gymnopus androsaceus JB14]|uniref:P-loop containing nucleoside triphosphate hydrolase protein n=1 Tax=Gymnopus androsaceus JB14 TaxID=1447944 RepID=A0A6A4HHN2_9AGAR|nr:P-loop containing nucleoside triphosphate hydrolase protein [Gymnopus androsaceus JB14]
MASHIQKAFQTANLSGFFSSGSTNATLTSESPNLFAMLPLLFTSSAIRDWAKLIVIGGIFETCRRFASNSYSDLLSSFRIEAVFDDDDPTYGWMLIWLSKQPSWREIRAVEVVVDNNELNDSHTIVLEEEGLSKYDGRIPRKVVYTPSPSRTYSMWYKQRYMTVTRIQEQTSRWSGKSNALHISILSRNSHILKDLIRDARMEFLRSQDNRLSIYTSDSTNTWRRIGTRPKRSLESIVLDPGMKELLLEDANDFLTSREWYSERGIPFRRGYLLYGAPGCGKTSLIHSIAGALDLDVYIISLSRTGLDDNSLDTLITELPERCVALMEDIDAALSGALNRDEHEQKKEATDRSEQSTQKPGPTPIHTGSRVSLSGLLNCLDGIGAAEGRILFATTNKYTSLDSALCRPGRMDLHIEFKLASKYQARELFYHFYRPVKSAVNDSEKGSKVGGTVNTTEKAPSENTVAVVGDVHQHARFSEDVIKALASQFADLIPERQLSMAAIQGFLMTYKTRPYLAVEKVAGWVEEEMSKPHSPKVDVTSG